MEIDGIEQFEEYNKLKKENEKLKEEIEDLEDLLKFKEEYIRNVLARFRVNCDIKTYVNTNCYSYDELLELKRKTLQGYKKVIDRLKENKNNKKIPTWELSAIELEREIKIMEENNGN